MLLTDCRSINDMLKTLLKQSRAFFLVNTVGQLQEEISRFMHPQIDSDTWRPKTSFSYGIIHIHGPSGAGKSLLALQLQAQLGGHEEVVILERDLYIKLSLAAYNRQYKKKNTIKDLYFEPKGNIKPWAMEHIFQPADDNMIRALYCAHLAGKVVIWDTMKELDKTLDLTNTLVVRMISQCLDSPDARDFVALAARKPGSMTSQKQKDLSSIVFKDILYQTKLNNGDRNPVYFNAYYGWTSSDSQIELRVFHDVVLHLFSKANL